MRGALSILRYAILLLTAGFLSALLNVYLTSIYSEYFRASGGAFDIDLTGVAVLHSTFEFMTIFAVILLGDNVRYWVGICVTLILLIPRLLVSDTHIPLSIGLMIIAAGIAYVIRLIATKTLGKIPALEPMKKYF